MNVYFYDSFNKRGNSTLRPNIIDTSQFDTHACTLKHDCSEHDPVLLLNSGAFNYVYAYIPDWHKYYYVRDVVSKANNLVEYHLSEDPLATYKGNIGITESRIMYSSNGYDPFIIDSRLQVKSTWKKDLSYDVGTTLDPTERPVFKVDSQGKGIGGGYILTVFNNGLTHSSGISTSYLLNENAMSLVKNWLSLSSAAAYFNNYFNGNMLNGIFGITWTPFDIPSELLTWKDHIFIGDRNQNADNIRDFNPAAPYYETCYEIHGFPKFEKRFKLPIYLRYATGNVPDDFRAFEPYTTGNINLPGIGIVEMKMSDWKGSKYVNVVVIYEAITGNMKYILTHDNGIQIQSFECNVAATCPLGQITTNSAGMMTGLGTTIGGLVTLAAAIATEGGSLAIMAGAGAAITGVANTVLSANQHGMSVSGSFGSRISEFNPYIYHTEFSVDTEDPDDADYIALQGRPYDGVAIIRSLVPYPIVPIYVRCIDGRVAPSTTVDGITYCPNLREQEEINDILNSGFYYE